MKITKKALKSIIQEELEEGIGRSFSRMRSAEELAESLAQLEEVMKFLLQKKIESEPGSDQHEMAQDRLVRLAAVAQQYADVGALKEGDL